MNYSIIKPIATVSVLVLLGAGCFALAPESPKELTLEQSLSRVSGGTQDACQLAVASTLYERPRLLPNDYPRLEILGPLFTAAPCGESRLRQILEQSEGALTLDMVVRVKAQTNTKSLRKHLTNAGFLCGDNLAVDGCYTRQAGTPVDTLLTLQPFADALAGDYAEDAYTAFDETFSVQYPIDPTSSLCTSDPVLLESGVTQYPVADRYAVYGSALGAFMTQYQCPAARRVAALGNNGLYKSTIDLQLKRAPIDAFLRALQQIGFVCVDGEQDESMCRHWTVSGSVPQKRLIHLEPFTHEIRQVN